MYGRTTLFVMFVKADNENFIWDFLNFVIEGREEMTLCNKMLRVDNSIPNLWWLSLQKKGFWNPNWSDVENLKILFHVYMNNFVTIFVNRKRLHVTSLFNLLLNSNHLKMLLWILTEMAWHLYIAGNFSSKREGEEAYMDISNSRRCIWELVENVSAFSIYQSFWLQSLVQFYLIK